LAPKRSGVILLILISGTKLSAVGCGLGLLGAVAASRFAAFLFCLKVARLIRVVLALFPCHGQCLLLGAGSFCTYRPRRASNNGSHAGFARANRKMAERLFGKPRVYCNLALWKWDGSTFKNEAILAKTRPGDPFLWSLASLGFPLKNPENPNQS